MVHISKVQERNSIARAHSKPVFCALISSTDVTPKVHRIPRLIIKHKPYVWAPGSVCSCNCSKTWKMGNEKIRASILNWWMVVGVVWSFFLFKRISMQSKRARETYSLKLNLVKRRWRSNSKMDPFWGYRSKRVVEPWLFINLCAS